MTHDSPTAALRAAGRRHRAMTGPHLRPANADVRDAGALSRLLERASAAYRKGDAATAELLQLMGAYFESMAGATATAWGPGVEPPPMNAQIIVGGIEVFVDLAGVIDVDAEIARIEKERDKLAASAKRSRRFEWGNSAAGGGSGRIRRSSLERMCHRQVGWR